MRKNFASLGNRLIYKEAPGIKFSLSTKYMPLAQILGKFRHILIITAIGYSTHVFADWHLLDKLNGLGDLYAEMSRLKQDGNIVAAPMLLNLHEQNKRGVRSTVYIQEHNCNTREIRTAWGQTYSGSMGSGKLLKETTAPSEWRKTKPPEFDS